MLREFKEILFSFFVLNIYRVLFSLLFFTISQAQTPITLYNTISGNVNYTVIGGTLRAQANPNSCTLVSSSSSTLSIPSGATVVAAYLYWAGSYSTTPDFQVQLDATTINASRTFTLTYNLSGTLLPFFSGFADVTAQVSAKGNGSYTFSNLTVNSGNPHCNTQTVLSAWAMVVVYRSPAEYRRSINIWDGFQYFRGSSITFNPNNFYIPITQIDGKLTHITWEGDAENSAALNGFSENLYFNGSILSDAINPVNNQFNSASSGLGLTNTYGVDIDTYNISSYLKSGDTSAVSTYATGGDLVLLSCEIISTTDTSSADLQISKVHSGGASIVAGNTTTFTISVNNNGPDTTGTITVIDTLPSGVRFVSASGSGWTVDSTAKPRYVFQHAGYHPPGTSLPPLNIVAYLTHEGYPKIYNRASVSSLLPDRRLWNNAAIDSITILTPIFLQSTKVFTDLNGGSVVPHDTIRYTIKVKNTGNYPGPNVTVVDTLPLGVSVVPGSLNPAGSFNGRVITFNPIASIAVGDSTTLTYRVVVDSSIVGGQLATNYAHIRSLTVDQLVSTSFTPVNAPKMFLQKSRKISSARPNDTLTYTIVYGNGSSLTISNGTTIIDTLPSSVTYVPGSATGGAIWYSSPAPKGRLEWSLGTINPGVKDSVSFRVVIDGNTPPNAIMRNTARLTNIHGSSVFSTRQDTVRFGVTATLTATPIIIPRDTIFMVLSDADLNKNPSVIESYTLKDSSSNGELEYPVFTETGPNTGVFSGKRATVFGLTAGINNDGVFNTKAGDTITVIYLDTLREDGSSALIFAKTIVRGGHDALLTSTPVIYPRDTMFITLTDFDLNKNSGVVEIYTLRDSNIVTGEVENITFTESGPNTGVFYGKIKTQFGMNAGANNDGKFNVKANDTLLVSYLDSLRANGGSVWLTTKTVVRGGFTATIVAVPNLIAAGDSITFILTDTDLDKRSTVRDTVLLVGVSSTLEVENLIFIESALNSGIFISGIKTIYGNGPGPNNNGIFTVLPSDSIVTSYHDSMTTVGDTANIKAVVKIGSVDFITSSKRYRDHNSGLPEPLDSISYTIVVRNSGTVTASMVTVHDTLPFGITIVPGSINPGGVLAGRVITFTPFSLGSGDSILLRFTAIIDSNVQDQATINNIARIAANGIIQLVNVSFLVSNKPSMTITKTVNKLTALPGDTVTYIINYYNISKIVATNVTISDTIPTNTEYIPGTVELNGVFQTDLNDADEGFADGVIIRITLHQHVVPGANGNIKYKVRVK